MHYAYDDKSIVKYEFSKEKAAALFEEAGWKLNAKTGKTRKKTEKSLLLPL